MDLGKIAWVIPLLTYSTIKSLELSPIDISAKDARKIGQKIQRNECNVPVTITWWKKGEDHASLGIGHWIWYPEGSKKTVPETFPSLLKFMAEKGKPIPQVILGGDSMACPWRNIEHFMQQLYSPKMQLLRRYLYQTIDLQTHFIMQRPQQALNALLNSTQSEEEKRKITANANRLIAEPQGLYALVDYLNFKGEGIASCPQYNGHNWGLKQVLLEMDEAKKPLEAFAEAAKKILQRRIDNAPGEKKSREQSWRDGWFKRIDTYLAN